MLEGPSEGCREKAVPNMLRDLVDQVSRIGKVGEQLETSLKNGLRPVDNVPTKDGVVADDMPEGCQYQEQLAGVLGQLGRHEGMLLSILNRLEI